MVTPPQTHCRFSIWRLEPEPKAARRLLMGTIEFPDGLDSASVRARIRQWAGGHRFSSQEMQVFGQEFPLSSRPVLRSDLVQLSMGSVKFPFVRTQAFNGYNKAYTLTLDPADSRLAKVR